MRVHRFPQTAPVDFRGAFGRALPAKVHWHLAYEVRDVSPSLLPRCSSYAGHDAFPLHLPWLRPRVAEGQSVVGPAGLEPATRPL